jgi:plastocyanin
MFFAMSRRLLLILSCTALALPVAGCGGDEESGGGSSSSGSAPADSGSGTDAVKVGMEEIEYVPKEVKVKKGGTITWTNSDSVTHTVTKNGGPGPEFDSGNMEVDATFEQKFTMDGPIDYVCTIHPSQTGTITVE